MVVYENEKLVFTDNDKDMYLNALIEELKLFKTENPLDVERGIDYIGIFEGRVFMQVEVENVLERHRDNFMELTAGDIEIDDDREKLIMPLTAIFLDGEVVETKIEVGA